MDTLNHLLAGFGVALTPMNLLVAALGAFIGTVVGMLPGLGPINGVAILMPLAFALKLPPETALILLAAVYIGCEYGGRISSILLNVPGDAGAQLPRHAFALPALLAVHHAHTSRGRSPAVHRRVRSRSCASISARL